MGWYGIQTGRLVDMEWLYYPGWYGLVWYGSLVWNGVLPMVAYHTLAGMVWSGMFTAVIGQIWPQPGDRGKPLIKSWPSITIVPGPRAITAFCTNAAVSQYISRLPGFSAEPMNVSESRIYAIVQTLPCVLHIHIYKTLAMLENHLDSDNIPWFCPNWSKWGGGVVYATRR